MTTISTLENKRFYFGLKTKVSNRTPDLFIDITMKHIFTYITIFLLLGCSQHKQQKEHNIIELSHQTLLGNQDILLGTPRLFALTDSFLVIYDSKADPLFYFISLSKHITSFGRKGQAPNEFLFPSSIYHFLEGDSICLFDANKRLVQSLSVTTNQEPQIHPLFSTKQQCHYCVMPLQGKQFVSAGIYDDARFYLLDKEGNILHRYEEYPYRDETEKNLNKRVLAQAYMGEFASNTKGDKFAFITGTARIISFFQIENSQIKLIKELNENYPDYPYQAQMTQYRGLSKNANSGYMSVTASDKHVFALFSGRSYKEYDKNAYMGNEVFVFDWNGTLLKTFKLDIFVSQIRVNYNENLLYAITRESDPEIITFTLP